VLKTNLGDITIELNAEKAPATVENFLTYVKEGFYNGKIFHRVISDFMIQGGGFNTDMEQAPTHDPIVNEAANGLKNDRGTIAMARTNDPQSATAQFFINVKDNDPLNYTSPAQPGYAVFGQVVEGMDVVDAIKQVKTTQRMATMQGQQAPMSDVPEEPVVIASATVVE